MSTILAPLFLANSMTLLGVLMSGLVGCAMTGRRAAAAKLKHGDTVAFAAADAGITPARPPAGQQCWFMLIA
jgi:hypothetical protein